MSNSLATKLNKRKHVDIGAKAARSKSKRLRLDSTKDIELAQLIEEPGIESAAAIPELKGPISKKLSSAAQRFIVFIGMASFVLPSKHYLITCQETYRTPQIQRPFPLTSPRSSRSLCGT